MKKILGSATFVSSEWESYKTLYTVPTDFETNLNIYICQTDEHESNGRVWVYVLPESEPLVSPDTPPDKKYAIGYYNKESNGATGQINDISLKSGESIVVSAKHGQVSVTATGEELEYNSDDMYNIVVAIHSLLSDRRDDYNQNELDRRTLYETQTNTIDQDLKDIKGELGNIDSTLAAGL